MATLNSPGVQVQVIDESFYTPAAPGTVPMIFVASAQDKTNPSGSIAQGTSAANAGKVWLITSQRDLTDTFGTPLFYTDTSGNPQHGNELNEYGLQSAYSVLGVSSRAYIVRADLDTTQLVPTSDRPDGTPVAGTYWVDTNATAYGIKEWNSTTQRFTVKTPIVLDDSSPSNAFDGVDPARSIGLIGDYCAIVTSSIIRFYRKSSSNTWVALEDTFDGGKQLVISPHYEYPTFNGGTPTGSTWITTTTPSSGANWSVKYYNGATQDWSSVSAPIYSDINTANATLDPQGGGTNVAIGSLFIDYDIEGTSGTIADFRIWRKNSAGVTSITSPEAIAIATEGTYSFNIRESAAGSTSYGVTRTVSINPTLGTENLASLIPEAISAAGLVNITASYNATTKKLTITHAQGGNFELSDGTAGPLNILGFTAYNLTTRTGTVNLYNAPSNSPLTLVATNWRPLTYEARENAPTTTPADGTLWYSSVVDEVDILYHNGTTWVGYNDSTAFPNADPNGPIISVLQPTEQSTGDPLVAGDIWVSTDDVNTYGRVIYVYSGSEWVLQDVTDQSTPDGWLFADARWATTGQSEDPSTIVELLSSNYIDPDAPDPALYPRGMHLWNTRRSGFNVKKYISGHINIDANDGENIRFENETMDGAGNEYFADRWVSQYPIAEDGGPQFGRLAQRAQVVNAFKELIDANATIRDTDTLNFNLMATPGYPEAIQNMIALNNERGITAFVLGDTPFRLAPTGTELTTWGLNTNGAFDNGDDGATSYDEYMAMYYPSGYTTDNTGNYIVVPPSHMMLRTIINSDAKSFQWFAPAGTRRGTVDNATSVGYIDGEGEFKTVALHQGLRDVLDDVKINPIATLTGIGVLAYGQRTRARNASALDRINVARLVCYLRRQLDVLARPFLFEPNDAQTRREIKAAAESLMLELVGQRALYDFVVVCDETNNTPARIDRSELYVDIAIEPVKAVEFIYIPLRLKNTGDIAAGL
jgi:hypothetical protein